MNKNKTTYKTAVQYALDNLMDAPADITERLAALLGSLEKKSGTERKLTKEQEANIALAHEIADHLTEVGEGKTVSDITKAIPALDGMSNQRVSALCRKAEQLGLVEKYTDKRKTYFRAVQGV